jgi:hypothetical protein
MTRDEFRKNSTSPPNYTFAHCDPFLFVSTWLTCSRRKTAGENSNDIVAFGLMGLNVFEKNHI